MTHFSYEKAFEQLASTGKAEFKGQPFTGTMIPLERVAVLRPEYRKENYDIESEPVGKTVAQLIQSLHTHNEQTGKKERQPPPIGIIAVMHNKARWMNLHRELGRQGRWKPGTFIFLPAPDVFERLQKTNVNNFSSINRGIAYLDYGLLGNDMVLLELQNDLERSRKHTNSDVPQSVRKSCRNATLALVLAAIEHGKAHRLTLHHATPEIMQDKWKEMHDETARRVYDRTFEIAASLNGLQRRPTPDITVFGHPVQCIYQPAPPPSPISWFLSRMTRAIRKAT